MKKTLFILFCFFIVKSGFSQDTFTYKTVNASDTKENIIQLQEPTEEASESNGKSSSFASKRGGGTVTNGILGALSVSPSGGANYTIPIAVPPGLNSVQPEIALTFDSQAGRGIAGWGWNLSGVSSITRISSTQYHDDKIAPVDFDLSDRFALDGQRLIIKTGTYGTNGAVYQTEQYSNIKIVSYGTHPTSSVQGPQYFKVFYPDGSIAHYGYTNDSRSHLDYAISYWENPQGIRINYSYTTDGNTLYYDKITYGSRGTTTPINEIEFIYTNSRVEHSYIGGIEFKKAKGLREIKVKGNGVGYRNYLLQGNLYEGRLDSFTEFTGDNTQQRSAINFSYEGNGSFYGIEQSESIFNQLNLGNIEQRNAEVVSLDMSGDGKMDFIVYPKTGPDAKKKFWLFNDFQIGGTNLGTEVNTGVFEDIFPVNWLNYQNSLLANQGLAVIQNHVGPGFLTKFKVYSSGGAAQPIAYKYEKTWGAPSYFQNGVINRVPLKYVSGDFDGDGLSDVVALEENYNGSSISKAHFIKLDRRLTTNFSSYIGNLSSQLQSTDKLEVMDVNGDGKTDILQFREGKVYVYGLNDTNNSLQLLWQTTHAAIKMDYPIMPGDYNGDGKSDFMIFSGGNNNKEFFMCLSSGDDFIIEKNTYSFEYEASYNSGIYIHAFSLLPVDVNGDGKTDIISYYAKTDDGDSGFGDGTETIKKYSNEYSSSLDRIIFTNSSLSTISVTGPLKPFPIPIFISSDRPNENLEFASISDNRVNSFKFNWDYRKSRTLKTIENNGITTEIKYDQVNPNSQDENDPFHSPSYSSGSGQVYPYVNVNMAPSFNIVKELTETGEGITRTKKFLYKGAVSNASGLGFIGFEELKRTNWYGDGVGTLWSVAKHDPMLRNAVTEEWVAETSSSSPGQYVSKTNYFYDYDLIANPGSPSAPTYPQSITRNTTISGAQTDQAEQAVYLKTGFYSLGSNGTYLGQTLAPEEQPGASGYAGVTNLRLNKIEQDNGLTGVFTTETYTYDEYNNPTKTYRTFPGGSNTITFEYNNNVGATNNTYHVGRPTKKKETNTLNGSTFSTEEQYSYSNNLVSETKIKGNGTSWLTTAFTYDANGNVTQKTISADGVSSRTETFEYTGYGQRFLTKSTDAEGLETTFTYNASTGNLLTTTNPYSLVTTYEYDKWDRPIKEIDYLGKETVFGYTAQTGGGLKETTDYATGAKDETIYNAFGWVTKSGALSLDNQWVYKSFEYDAIGRLTRESEPYTGAASQWNTTGYDGYGRVVSQALFTGRTITTSYSNLTSTVNDGTKTVTTTVDALGNVVSVQDPGGTITYTHYANGAVKTADYGGNVVSTTIDGWGRKVSLNDPAAGNYTYSYNNYGKLLEETSPKGSTTYAYDAYGKPTSKAMTGDLTDYTLTYVYDGTTKLISSITGQDNTNTRTYSYNYTYDSYKRPSTIKENTGLAEFELQYTYDTYGRVHKETQIGKNLSNAVSSTITTRNVYDASGILSEIWNDGTPDKLWELDAINARGQALTINLGNGIAKTKIYDSYGYVTKIEDKETGSVPTPTVALHTTYSFNQQRGTLTSRNNVGFSHQENFGYDNLDRLTTIGGAVTKTMTYDTRGRITNNTDLGDYVYESTSKYRLKEITPNATGETYFQAHPTQQISYNAFKKPIDIDETGHGKVSFEYGPMMNRSHAYYGGDNADKLERRYKKHYSAITGTEIVEDTQTNSTKIITYVGGDAYTAPIAHIKRTSDSLDEYHYLHRDYLGSILAITDADGDVIEKRQFGAWGSVDKFLDISSGTTFNHQSLLNRGYTGHEHFFEVSLIHMNGRMYDSQVGRFLSPDNYIQEPFNTQNYNRYGYVLNNPLMYTDPTGELFGGEGGGILGGFVNLLWSGLKSLFGGYDATPGNNQGGYQNAAPIPAYYYMDGASTASIQAPRQPNPDWDFGLPNMVSNYYSSLWGGFKGRLNSTANGISSFFSDPFGTIGKAWDSHWDRVTNPIGFAQTIDEGFSQLSPLHQTLSNATKALHSDDFASTFGRLNGEVLADKTVEAASLAVGNVAGKALSSFGRFGSIYSKGINLADDAFVHVTPTRYTKSILSKGLDPSFSGGKSYVTRWGNIKNVTNASDFNTILYRQNLWESTIGKFDGGATILHINSKPTFFSPRTNWVNGVPQYIFTSPVSPKSIKLIKSF